MAEASRELIAEEKVELPDIRYNHLNCPKNGNCGDVPPIKEWEKRLVGKRLIKEDEEGDETVTRSYYQLYLKSDFNTDFQAIRPTTAIQDAPIFRLRYA